MPAKKTLANHSSRRGPLAESTSIQVLVTAGFYTIPEGLGAGYIGYQISISYEINVPMVVWTAESGRFTHNDRATTPPLKPIDESLSFCL
jgi:hypothetical protein